MSDPTLLEKALGLIRTTIAKNPEVWGDIQGLIDRSIKAAQEAGDSDVAGFLEKLMARWEEDAVGQPAGSVGGQFLDMLGATIRGLYAKASATPRVPSVALGILIGAYLGLLLAPTDILSGGDNPLAAAIDLSNTTRGRKGEEYYPSPDGDGGGGGPMPQLM